MDDLSARRLARAERRVEILEQLLEDKTRALYTLNCDLQHANAELATTQDVMPGALLVIDDAGKIVRVNRAACELLGHSPEELAEIEAARIWSEFQWITAHQVSRREVSWTHADGTMIPILLSTAWKRIGASDRLICVGLDLRERHRDEIARRHAQKLEALGALAAGVAHEINTPMQFISDNLHLIHRACESGLTPQTARAFDRARDGIARVANIVSALKLFSHPGNELSEIDLNRIVMTTLTVARPELRNVADVELALEPLPPILGHAGDLGQVLLNLLVNAAHAIVDARRETRGSIGVRTENRGDHVVVAIRDSGCGIPAAIQQRVYDPFFTTKEPGRGTGQGLALAHAVIADRHRGSIRFETSSAGTTFFVALPVRGAS